MRTFPKQQFVEPLPAQGEVVNIDNYRNRDVIRFARKLLEKALAGEVTGLIYTARLNGEDHGVSAVGVYARERETGLASMSRMANTLASHVSFGAPESR